MREDEVTAARACGIDRQILSPNLGASNVDQFLRVVQRLARGETFCGKLRSAIEGLLFVHQCRRRLRLGLQSGRKGLSLQLVDARLSLIHSIRGLRKIRLQLVILKQNERLPRSHRCAFVNLDGLDDANDLTGDIDAKRSQHVAARDNRFDDLGARHCVYGHRRSQPRLERESCSDSDYRYCEADRPTM